MTRGRGIPRERLAEVAGHYHHFGGVSPINDQNKALIDALEKEFAAAGLDLPIYWGNRNWAPYVEDTWRQMAEDGIEHAYVFATSGHTAGPGTRAIRGTAGIASYDWAAPRLVRPTALTCRAASTCQRANLVHAARPRPTFEIATSG